MFPFSRENSISRFANWLVLAAVLLMTSSFQKTIPPEKITGDWVIVPVGFTSLTLKKNGTFRQTQHLIRIHSERGQWRLSGDTLILDYKDKEIAERRYFYKEKEDRLLLLDTSWCEYQRRRK